MTVPLWDISEVAAIMQEVDAMINDETKRKLRELNMSEIITGLEIQQSEPDTLAWSFDDRIQVSLARNIHTIDKLIEMCLTTMADAFRNQLDNPKFKEVPFEDRFGMLVDIEYSNRKNNR